MDSATLDDLVTHYVSQKLYLWLPPASLYEDLSGMPSAGFGQPILQNLDKGRVGRAISRLRDRYCENIRLTQYLDQQRQKLIAEFEQIFNSLAAKGVTWVGFSSAFYPPLLRQIKDPPAGFFALGDWRSLSKPVVAVVGARKASGCSLAWSERIGFALATSNLAVVSGGAFGCDIHAHRGVLNSEFHYNAIVVFPGGLSNQCPVRFKSVFQDILDRGGLLISERLPWEAPQRRDYHCRNRLIAGLASVVVVVQAAERSGTMITARIALEEGRDVWVRHPPEPDDIRFAGNEKLIEDGAPTWNDVRIESPFLAN